MKEGLYTAATVYALFGATMYLGTMWVLRLFLYPTWKGLTPDAMKVHFDVPVLRATRFFTFTLPPMWAAGVILIIAEWGSWWVVLPAVYLFTTLFVTIAFQFFVRPVNVKVMAGGYDQAGLDALLGRWMQLNMLRFWGATAMWPAIVAYAVAKPDLYSAFS